MSQQPTNYNQFQLDFLKPKVDFELNNSKNISRGLNTQTIFYQTETKIKKQVNYKIIKESLEQKMLMSIESDIESSSETTKNIPSPIVNSKATHKSKI